jgi:hypothetical protein
MSVETEICREVYAEIKRSDKLHGPQRDLPLGCDSIYENAALHCKSMTDRHAKSGQLTWLDIAMEEAMECFAETDLDRIREEAIQASAMFAKIALTCDHQKELTNPLTPLDRVTSSGYGKGTIEAIDAENSVLGPVAWIRWDNRPNDPAGVRPFALDWAKKLERI